MELTERVLAVLKHGQFVNGPEVREFEAAMADYIGVLHAVSVNSGTDALIFALRVLGLHRESRSVVVPAFSFSATAAAVALAEAHIVFADISEQDFGIDVNSLHDPEGLDGMIAVDMFGIPCDWPSVIDFCNTYRLKLIEDAAQALGARYAGAKCGSIGMIGCTSFYPSKPLSCAGDGGMVLTNFGNIAQRVRALANHGRTGERYEAEFIGENSRLDTIQAAILLDRLQVFESREIPCRIAQAQEYFNRLTNVKQYELKPAREPVWSWYPVLYDTKKERDEAFQDYGGYVGARIIYPTPLHLMPAFNYLGYKRGDFPVAESVCERILAFPIVHHWEVNRCLCTITNAESASIALRS